MRSMFELQIVNCGFRIGIKIALASPPEAIAKSLFFSAHFAIIQSPLQLMLCLKKKDSNTY